MTDEGQQLTFSEANGYVDAPVPLKLKELPQAARNQIWSVLYGHLRQSTRHGFGDRSPLDHEWRNIAEDIHTRHFVKPIDEWDPSLVSNVDTLKPYVLSEPFNRVFDLVQFMMQHRECPAAFLDDLRQAFRECRLAYVIASTPTPTITAAATPVEGVQIEEAVASLERAGLTGSLFHLGKAATSINEGDWADSVRESISAVESVARQIAPGKSQTLGHALKTIDHGSLHPALRAGFERLYGYTCDEQGIRHPVLEKDGPDVTIDEAVFMLGACASFASYLCRKHVAAGGP